VSAIIGDDLILLLTEELNFYHSQNAEKWKSRLKHNWSNIIPEEMRKYLGLIILMGQVRKENIRDYWSTDNYCNSVKLAHTLLRENLVSAALWGLTGEFHVTWKGTACDWKEGRRRSGENVT
jgi:hypothetical protein